jgi:hypothetical protein
VREIEMADKCFHGKPRAIEFIQRKMDALASGLNGYSGDLDDIDLGPLCDKAVAYTRMFYRMGGYLMEDTGKPIKNIEQVNITPYIGDREDGITILGFHYTHATPN